MKASYKRIDDQHILYDASFFAEAGPALFEIEAWVRRGQVMGEAKGRGTSHFVTDGKYCYVLRHYLRGGVLANVVHDRYLWLGLSRARAWQEWQLLYRMFQMGLPVPRPVAARVIRSKGYYRADLLTLMVPMSHSLASLLEARSISEDLWKRIGRCLRLFHNADIFHADLNAHNILIDHDRNVYLIDFDKGKARIGTAFWKGFNLSRLHRSLLKVTKGRSSFSKQYWQALLIGYRSLE